MLSFQWLLHNPNMVSLYLETEIPANLGAQLGQLISDALHVLVTTATQADDNILTLLHCLGKLNGTKDTVSSLKSRNDTLELTHEPEAKECLSISGSNELGSLVVLPRAQLRSDTGVIETCRNGMCLGNLTVLVLENVRPHTMQDALGTTSESSTMSGGVNTITTCLNTQKLDSRLILEGVEHADSVTATTNTSHNGIGKLASLLEHLLLGLVADY